MRHRLLIVASVVGAVLGTVASAHAATGDLTFRNCAAGPASAAPPCIAQPLVAHPTDLTAIGYLGVTSATNNTAAALNAGLMSVVCFDDGVGGCPYHTNAAIDDPQAAASTDETQTYIAGGAHDAIAELFPTSKPTSACIAEAAALGCDLAHGLHHPARLALTPDAKQLYAATGDGVAWFNIAPGPGPPRLSFGGCLGGGACTPGPVVSEQAIAISPDGTDVYVGSSNGTLYGFRRAADGSLTQVACVFESPFTPADCAHADALYDVNGLAISPDGASLYAVSATAGAVTAYARAADGTIKQIGCVSSQDLPYPRCTTDSHVSTVDSVTVSPDGHNVYAGDPDGDVSTFVRASDGSIAPASCIGATGGACVDAPTFRLNPEGGSALRGAIVVSKDGGTVSVAAADGVSNFAREKATDSSADSQTVAFPPRKDPLALRGLKVVRVGHGTQLRYRVAASASVTVWLLRMTGGRHLVMLHRNVRSGAHALTLRSPHQRRLAAGRYHLTIAARPRGTAAQDWVVGVRHMTFTVGRG